jgi:nucleotide-binding universal stress UspA family protein
MRPLTKILVPIDWGKESKRDFQLAASLAGEHNAQLIVLYAVPVPAVIYGPPPASYLDHLRQDLCSMKPSDPKIRMQSLLIEGNPAAAILEVAKETNCDLIVMGTHGRSGLNRLLKGSVAEEVMRKAPCPVMTLNSELAAHLIG